MDRPDLASAIVGAAYLTAYVACALAVAWRLGKRWAGSDRLLLALLVSLLTIGQAVGIPLLLGMMGLLTRLGVLVAHLLLFGVVVAGVRAREREGDAAPQRWSPIGLATLAAGAFALFAAAVPTLRAIATTSYDSRDYHITNLAAWLIHHNVWVMPYQDPAFYTAAYPGNGELFSLWLILPTHSDQLAYLSVIPAAILAVLAVASIARDLGGSVKSGMLAGLAIVAAPVTFETQAHSIMTDLMPAALIAAAVALLVRAHTSADERARFPLVACAGVALGLGVGSKYTVLIPAAAVVIWALFGVRPRRALWSFLVATAFFAAPWFIRDSLRTGNPLFPLDVKVAGAHVLPGGTGPLDYLRTTLAHHFAKGHTAVIRSWAKLVAKSVGPAGLLVAGGIFGSARRDDRRAARLLVAALAVLALLVWIATPFTGAGPDGTVPFLLNAGTRYGLLAFFLGAALAAAALPEIASSVVGLAAVAYDLYKILRGTSARADLHMGSKVAAVGVLVSIVAVGIGWGWAYLRSRLGSSDRAVSSALRFASVVVIMWLIGGALVHHIDGARLPSKLEQALNGYRHRPGSMIVIGVGDMRSVIGDRLDAPIATVQAGKRRGSSLPFATAGALTQAIDHSNGTVLVVTSQPNGINIPPGWEPSTAWTKVGEAEFTSVYVR